MNYNKLNFLAGRFSAMTTYNLEYWYNKKLNNFYYRKSAEVNKGASIDDEFFIKEYDQNGDITNASFNRRTKQGFLITEKDFIDSELAYLKNNFDWETLDFSQRKTLEAYKEFLHKKLKPQLPNPYELIFSSGEAFALFSELHNIYKNYENKLLANYSFLFYAMEKDNFLVCTGKEFVDFLGTLTDPVYLDRIKSTQKDEVAEKKGKYLLYHSKRMKYFPEKE